MSDVYIDDGDASVAYSGTWESFYSQRAYRNSEHSTKTVNSRATLTFTGINVMVYGTVRGSEAPQSSYSLDGGDQTVFTGTPLPITQYSVLCYTSPILRNAQHTLVITYIGNSTESFFLDRFTVVTTGAVSTNSSTSPGISVVVSTRSPTESSTTSSISESRSSTASRSSSVGNTTLVTLRSSGSSSDVLPPSSSTTQSGIMDTHSGTMPPNKSRPTAAIIGAIAAVSIVVFFSVIFIWLARRRKQQELKSWTSSESSSYESGGAAAPTEPASFTTSLPTEVTPEMNEQPPVYAMSEPPAYDADIGPVVRVQVQNDSQPLGTGSRLQRSGKS